MNPAHTTPSCFSTINFNIVRFEVLKAVVMKSSILCDVTPCRLTFNRLHGVTSQKIELPVLILFAYLRLGLLSGFFLSFFLSGVPARTVYTFCFAPLHVTCPSYLIFLNLIIRILYDEDYKLGDPHCAVLSTLLLCHRS
jgi:hypothetical protein